MKQILRAFRTGVLTLTASAVLSGCGAAMSTSALVRANQQFKAAEQADARKEAAYEFTLGEEYLRKALEEAGYSDYQGSIRLARVAETHLLHALQQAVTAGQIPLPNPGSVSEE